MLPLMMLSACGQREEKVPGISLADMDLTTAPGVDFYQYANGGWIASHPLKPEYARFGSESRMLRDSMSFSLRCQSSLLKPVQ